MSTWLRAILILTGVLTGVLVMWIILALILKYGFGVNSGDARVMSGCIAPFAFGLGGLMIAMCEDL